MSGSGSGYCIPEGIPLQPISFSPASYCIPEGMLLQPAWKAPKCDTSLPLAPALTYLRVIPVRHVAGQGVVLIIEGLQYQVKC